MVGIAIRLAIAPFTYARDFWYFVRAAASAGTNPQNLISLNLWSYPPPHLWVLFALYRLWSLLPVSHQLLLGGIPPLGEGVYVPYPVHDFLIDPLLVTLLKAPVILADLVIGVMMLGMLPRLGVSESRSKLAFKVWMLNPAAIWISSASGHFDAVPTLLAVYALLSAAGGRVWRASLSLGLGGAWKLWPFLLLPILLLFRREAGAPLSWMNLRRFLPVVVLTLLPIALITGFFLVVGSPWTFRSLSPADQPVGYQVLLGVMFPSSALGIPITLTAIIVLFVCFLLVDYEVSLDVANGLILSLLIVIVAFSPLGIIQYLYWLTPFLLIDWVLHPERRRFFLLTMGVIMGMLITSYDGLGFGFYYAAVTPQWFYGVLADPLVNLALMGILRFLFLILAFYYLRLRVFPLLKLRGATPVPASDIRVRG